MLTVDYLKDVGWCLYFLFLSLCKSPPVLKVPASSFMATLSTAGDYFEPHLSAALHKLLMRPCQTDVELPTFDLESVRVTGRGGWGGKLQPYSRAHVGAAPDGGETSKSVGFRRRFHSPHSVGVCFPSFLFERELLAISHHKHRAFFCSPFL